MSTQKRGSTYYSRVVVPSQLRHIVPRREVVKSLHVLTYPAARLRCAEWEARLYGLFAALETKGQRLTGREFDAELGKLTEPPTSATHAAHYSSRSPVAAALPEAETPSRKGEPLSVVVAAYIAEHRERSWTDVTIRMIIQLLPRDCWSHYGEAARLQLENILIASIREGLYDDENDKCKRGALGTWASGLAPYFSLKEELEEAILSRLDTDNIEAEDYVFEYLFDILPTLDPDPAPFTVYSISKGLKSGKKNFYDAVEHWDSLGIGQKWRALLKEDIETFEEKPRFADDIPF